MSLILPHTQMLASVCSLEYPQKPIDSKGAWDGISKEEQQKSDGMKGESGLMEQRGLKLVRNVLTSQRRKYEED